MASDIDKIYEAMEHKTCFITWQFAAAGNEVELGRKIQKWKINPLLVAHFIRGRFVLAPSKQSEPLLEIYRNQRITVIKAVPIRKLFEMFQRLNLNECLVGRWNPSKVCTRLHASTSVIPYFRDMKSFDIEGFYQLNVTDDDRRILNIKELFTCDDPLQRRQHLVW